MLRLTALFTLLGLGLLGLSILSTNATRAFVDDSVLTEGTVLRVERIINTRSASAASMRYNYVIWFPTRSGKTIAVQRQVSDRKSYFRPGDLIPIRYEPASPKRTARIGTAASIWRTPVLLAAAGIGCLMFAVVFAARGRRCEIFSD